MSETRRVGRSRTGVPTVGALLEPASRGVPARVLALVEGQLLLGRDDECDVVFLSERVSRRHARVWCFSDGRYAVEDLRSLNGTYVDGRRIAGVSELADGSRLVLGDAELRFRLLPASVPAAPRRPTGPDGERPHPATEPMPPRAVLPWAGELPDRPAGPGVAATLGLFVAFVAVSLGGAVLGHALDWGPWGALALASLTPLVAALALGSRRTLAALVALVAVVVTVLGVTATDAVRGRSVLPWVSQGGTFVAAPTLSVLHGIATHAPGPAGARS